jgi:hypothetical protein
LICLPVAFAVGALAAVLARWYPVWAYGLRYAGTFLLIALVATATRYAIDRHVERTPYDGNDRSSVLPPHMRRRL